jgi:hypothetical protein
VVSTFFSVVTVAVPPGPLVVVSVLVLDSSEQPESPTPNAMATTPVIVKLISFLNGVPSMV